MSGPGQVAPGGKRPFRSAETISRRADGRRTGPGDPNVALIADNANLATLPLAPITAEMTRFEALFSADKLVGEQNTALIGRIVQENSALPTLETRLFDEHHARDGSYPRVRRCNSDERHGDFHGTGRLPIETNRCGTVCRFTALCQAWVGFTPVDLTEEPEGKWLAATGRRDPRRRACARRVAHREGPRHFRPGPFPSGIRRDRTDRGSSPCPKRRRSRPRTAARRPRTRRPPRSPAAESSTRRRDRPGCLST